MELQTVAKKKKAKKESGCMNVEEVEEEEEEVDEMQEGGGLDADEVEEVGNGMWFRRRLGAEDMRLSGGRRNKKRWREEGETRAYTL